MRSGRQRALFARYLRWAAVLIPLVGIAYLAGAQLARFWATPVPRHIPATPTTPARVDSLVPGGVANGTSEPGRMDRWRFYARTDEACRTRPDAPSRTVTATPEAIAECHDYTVLKGDVLWDIALAFGVTVDAIVDANDHLASADAIDPGMVLCIPDPPPTPTPLPEGYYVVQVGDTLWSLAWEFQCTMEDWLDANAVALGSPLDHLDVGQILRIPEHSSLDERPNCVRVRERQQVITYLVRSGDNLSCLAQRFGISMATIQWANMDQLSTDPHLVYPGQRLTILPLDGVLHAIAQGETLEGIAEQYQVDAADIVAWVPNELVPQSKLTAGWEIVIPNGVPPLHLWGLPAERPPSVSATPSPSASDESMPLGALRSRHDPWYLLSWYDTGYCANPPPGWGWSGRLSWPTDGHEIDIDRGFRRGHPAIDILASLGSPVYAAETGVVIWAGYNTWGYGNLVVLDHGGGWLTLYVHLDSVYADCGQAVSRGEVIGTVGQTGSSSFPHLHFEVRRSGFNFNPLDWLP
jgi:murein DD-endopeptidase MepM/ murein hydrolase activator NlpD